MKRCICLLLFAVIIVSLCACENDRKIRNPVNLYYLTADVTESDMLIQPEVREASGSLEDQLNLYLNGPLDESYTSPFPNDVSVVSIKQSDGISELVLSDSFASLKGYDLTVACACLTKTMQELVNTQLIKIRAENVTLDGNAYITMTADAIITIDSTE